MPRTIRFHLDENCTKAIAVGLRRRGIEVTTTPEAGLLGAIDEAHAAYSLSQGRIIFTQDRDFLRIYAAGVLHAGIAYCAAVAAAALEHPNLPGFNENWLELSAKAGATDFAFITRKGQGQPVPYAKSARCRLFIAVGETMHQACPCRRKDQNGAARRGRLN